MRGSKESATILLILLLAATALSSPGSFPNGAGVGTFGDFKVVNISDDPSFSSQVGCGLIRVSIRSDEVFQDCTVSNTLRAVDSKEQSSYNLTRSPVDDFNPLYLLPFATTTLNGVVYDEYENQIEGAVVEWTDCDDNHVVSDTTDADGEFSLTATPGSYKSKVVYNGITYPFTVNDEECPYYGPDTWNLDNPLAIRTWTTLHGYIKDLDNNPLQGLTVALHDCSGDLVASDDTDSSGHFSITTDAGDYEIHLIVSEWYRIQILDSGESCFRMVGDADFGTLKISPTPDCSKYNYLCYGPEMKIKLFNCYWDDGCRCFMHECPCGCTDGLPECDSCETGTIYIDVDNRNNNKPQPGAKIYLDDEYRGTTDSLGKKSVDAGYGSHKIRVDCPGGTGCGLQEFYVNGDEYRYFDCDCGTHLAALQVNVDNINGYPVANVYVYVDGEERALTCPFGYVYIENVPYGDRHIDIRYSITNPDFLGDYQKSLDITVDEEKEVVDFIATLPDRSQLVQARSLGDSSNFTRIENFTPQVVVTGAVAMAVIDIASVTWSTDEFCSCMFQEEGSSGIEQCISAMTGCGGDIRGCIREIRENAGPAANRCKFEGAMLVGDVASPFVPVGFIGHGVAAVVGERRVLRIADNIGESGRIIKTKVGGEIEYVKDDLVIFAKWFDDLCKFKRYIVKGTEHWSDDALWGLESIARAGGEGPEGKAVAGKFVAELTEEYGDGYVQKIAKGVKELQEREITGADKVTTKIVESKNSLSNLKGIAFEVEVATDSRYIDDVTEVRRDIPNGEIDILLKNDDIIEAKNFDWNKMDKEQFDEHKCGLGGQIRKYKYCQINTLNNPDAEIKVVFKNEDLYWYPRMRAFLEDDKGVLVEVL